MRQLTDKGRCGIYRKKCKFCLDKAGGFVLYCRQCEIINKYIMKKIKKIFGKFLFKDNILNWDGILKVFVILLCMLVMYYFIDALVVISRL